ncbi:MAG: hypothetical protein DRG11_06490 [Epsilonproteobacteria bacterium]|nr:MAG: hypothetical protein DRG11_06490 [Campylobacterota bacterium]
MFVGLASGAIFTIYKPLDPSIFSVGGVFLSFGLLIVAYNYDKLININRFRKIVFFVEIVMLLVVALYILLPYDYQTALLIYIGYQLTFMFGSYLLRAETIFVSKVEYLSRLDRYKQFGYLAGLVLSWVFYKVLSNIFSITTNQTKIYILHFVLIFVEFFILFFLFKSFKK